MTEELELFLEDMDEQLSLMESTLLDISDIPINEVDKEKINTLFRAMHTMKGNAGVFGYEVIIDFAHKAENLLDEIRNDRIKLKEEMIDLFLHVNDHSKVLVEVYTQDSELNDEQKTNHEYLLNEISKFLNEDEESSTVIEEDSNEDESSKNYNIKVKLKDDFFRSGMDMSSIIKYLDVIGEVKSVKIIDKSIPLLENSNPLNASLEFEIFYTTSENKDEIIESFEFVQEDIFLEVSQIDEEFILDDEVTEEIIQEDIIEVKEDVSEEHTFKIFKKVKNKKEAPKTEEKKIVKKDKNFSLRVDSSKVDLLINQVSEMVIANAKINQYALKSNDPELEETVETMSEMLEEIRNGIMDIRMVQVEESFSKLRRIVNETAKKTNKKINFEIIGGETELDKTVIEKISDPLIHMLRNSIDHGVETPEVRIEHGKSEEGNVTLRAYPDAGSIVIEIEDDGVGIDKEKILEKAKEKNLIAENHKLLDKEIYDLLFLPGFSTAKQISDVSGRGVGMDVVKTNIQELRGRVEIDSKLGFGTKVTIRLPLTLAIIDGFLVQVGDSKYIVPLDNIQECVEFSKKAKDEYSQNGYISLRDTVLPILDVASHFEEKEVENIRKNIVIVKYGSSQVGLKVDELYGEYQTVIKPLGVLFENISGISGGTILGDGEIALIFDVQKLIEYKITHKDN